MPTLLLSTYIAHQHGKLTLKLKDDGIGFEPNDNNFKMHHGLLAICERVFTMKGEFIIDSAPGKGTILIVCNPL